MQKQFTKDHSFMVKGLAIILLLTYHLFENESLVTSLGVNHAPLSLPNFLMLTGFGNICVAVFVFLTAFGISKGLLAQEEIIPMKVYQQATKRFVTLMFHFLFMYVSINLLWWSKFDYKSLYGSGYQGLLYALTDATGLSMFFDTATLNMTWWYMEIAYILIFLVPLLAWLTKKLGYYMLLIAFFAPAVLNLNSDVERYLFTAVVGVCAAYGSWPDRLLNLKCKKVVQWVIGIVLVAISVPIRQNYAIQESYDHLIDAPVAVILVFFAGVLLASVPVLNKVLAFIGKHSMNIYLVHTFFYMALWQKFIYQFEYAGVTLVLLLVTCLAYSVVLEFVKKWFLKLWQKGLAVAKVRRGGVDMASSLKRPSDEMGGKKDDI